MNFYDVMYEYEYKYETLNILKIPIVSLKKSNKLHKYWKLSW